MPLWLIVVFLLVIAVLTGIAAYLHWQLYRKRKTLKQQQHNYEHSLQQKKHEAAQSIEVIARCYVDDQVELGEAALRLHHLLQYFDFDEDTRNQLKVFDEVAARIAHIPVLQDWKSLDKQTRAKHRLTLESIDTEFSSFAKDAARKIVDMQLTR